MLWWIIVAVCVVTSIVLGAMYGKDMESAKDGWIGFGCFMFLSAVIAFAAAIGLSVGSFSSSNFDQIKVEDYEIVEDGNIRETYDDIKVVVRENGKITEKTFNAGDLTLAKGDNPPAIHVETFERTAPAFVPWNLGTQQYVTITSRDIVQITPN